MENTSDCLMLRLLIFMITEILANVDFAVLYEKLKISFCLLINHTCKLSA